MRWPGSWPTDDELYFLEPASRFFGPRAAGETLAYRLSDVVLDQIPLTCGTGQRAISGRRGKTTPGALRRALRELLGGAATRTAAAGALQEAELGLAADFEYYSAHEDDSATDLAEIVNSVDGIYQSEVNVSIALVSTVVFTTVNDPFSGTNVPVTLLGEVANWRNNNDNNSSQAMWQTDLTHLFTGRDLQNNVIGIAYLRSLCDSDGAAGVDQDWTSSLNLMTLLLAHEMGHNFGAPHDNQAGVVVLRRTGHVHHEPRPRAVAAAALLALQQDPGSTPMCRRRDASTDAGPPPPTNTPTNTPTPTSTPTPTLGVPSVTDPSSGQVIGVEGVTFTWTAVNGATGYDLRVLNQRRGDDLHRDAERWWIHHDLDRAAQQRRLHVPRARL